MSESYSRCGITQSEKLSKCSETAFYLSFVYAYPILPRDCRERTNYKYHNRGILTAGLVRLGQVRLGQVRLGQVRLGQERIGQVGFLSLFLRLYQSYGYFNPTVISILRLYQSYGFINLTVKIPQLRSLQFVVPRKGQIYHT